MLLERERGRERADSSFVEGVERKGSQNGDWKKLKSNELKKKY